MIEFATVARPYAKALYELAEEKAQTQSWLDGLAQLAWLVEQPKMSGLLQDSSSDAEQKAMDIIRLMDGVECGYRNRKQDSTCHGGRCSRTNQFCYCPSSQNHPQCRSDYCPQRWGGH